MRRSVLWGWLIAGMLLLSGCAPSFGAREAPPPEVAPAPPVERALGEESAPAELGPLPRMIVRRADLALVVQNTREAMEAIGRIAEEAGGYIASSNAYRVNAQLQAQMTIRVPAVALDEVLSRLRELATRVDRESISTEDVTAEYTDLESRLRNLEATERELLALLREVRERPNATAEDILSVHRRLTEVREEIERLKGRMQYLENQVALATVTISLIPDELAGPLVEPGWRPLRTARNAFRTLIRVLQGMADLAIWLFIVVLPTLLLISVPFVVLFLFLRKLWRRRRA